MSDFVWYLAQDRPPTFLEILAKIFGWLYFTIWGAYMYPQVFLNYKLKNVEGFKLDYPFLNLSGYVFITVCNTLGYFLDLPFDHYGLGKVQIQDVLYGINGTFVCFVLNLQALYYPRGKNKIAMFSFIFTIFIWGAALIFYLLSETYDIIPPSKNVNILIFLGNLKIVVNIVKYVPLIYFNFLRKTTVGMSIVAFGMNLIGAIFSLIQLGLDYHNGTTKTLSPVKLGLGAVTIFYDVILVFQYMLYRKPKIPMEYSVVNPEILTADSGSVHDRLLSKQDA